ncbi:MAG: hypothetical protein MZW92_63200 [Comamonadaceae bacterium]|nr:hypothetical protein [Comamonadaceae bacterium]
MSFDLVLFGGTGDLTWRKLHAGAVPGLAARQAAAAGGRILAVARDERSDDEYRAFIQRALRRGRGPSSPSDEEFARFAELLHYRRMDLSQPDALRRPEGTGSTSAAPTPRCCSWPPARTCFR